MSATPNGGNHISAMQIVREGYHQLIDEITNIIQTNTANNTTLTCQFGAKLLFGQRVVAPETNTIEEDVIERYISNRAVDINPNVLNEFLNNGAHTLDEKITTYTEMSSGYTVKKVSSLEFIFIKKNPLSHRASSFIKTPKVLAAKKAIINIKNKYDKLCFLYSVVCALKYNEIDQTHPDRANQYTRFFNQFTYQESDFPMRICNIAKFEHDNNVVINVLRWHDKPLEDMDDIDDDEKVSVTQNPFISREYMSKNVDENMPVINLLLLEDDIDSHYTWIKNLDKLMNFRKGNTAACHISHRHWCHQCFRSFRTDEAFQLHQNLCLKFLKYGPTVYNIPAETHVEFMEWDKTIQMSYVIYADFESVLEPCNDNGKLQKHMPIMASYLLVPRAIHDETTLPMRYEHFYGPECILQFLQSIEQTVNEVRQWYDDNARRVMRMLTGQQEQSYRSAQVCYLCKKPFTEKNYKVRDHCHVSGFYTGAAHNMCNLRRRQKRFLPVLFHNLRKYDMHHIMKHAIQNFSSWDISPIAQTSETFLALTCFVAKDTIIRFVDSLQFISTSLDNAVKQLDRTELKLSSTLAHNTSNGSKAIFPYSYVDNIAKLEHQSDNLPSYEEFFDQLTNKISITREEYNNANETYKRWNCKSLKDYYTIYLQLDVYLLADVFENFRNIARNEDGLEPLHFFSIPGMSWASAMKMTKCKLELLKDVEMYEWFESAIRGGMAFVNKHYSKREEGKQELLYVDVNNLYGWALSESLPTSDFKWITNADELDRLIGNINDMDLADGNIGYVFEIDATIPEAVHDMLDQLPLFPEHEVPPRQLFNNGKRNGKNIKKLIMSHAKKTNYIIHGRLLQLFMKLGAQVDKVHRAVQFQQAKVFQPYIQLNTDKRSQTTDDFKRNYYKLRNNSLYGKTCENVRKRKQVKLCNTAEKLIVCNSSTRMRRSIEIAQDLVAVFLGKTSIKLDKPIYIGQAVLDLSKLVMYRLYYEKLMKYAEEFRNGKINILGGDTDSFFLELQNIPLRSLLQRMKDDHLLDTSNFNSSDPLYSKVIASKIGCVKDECAGVPIQEMVLLQPKCYSAILVDRSYTIKRAKGVQRVVLHTELDHESYKRIYHQFANCFLEEEEQDNDSDLNPPLVKRQRRIGSENHQLYTFSYNKIALACRDNKRQWVGQNMSFAFGHWRLKNW